MQVVLLRVTTPLNNESASRRLANFISQPCKLLVTLPQASIVLIFNVSRVAAYW